ncbi:MAG: hypothetical protein GF329_11650 [Candidatus Lokiarchaeota archaeon]|nr:hypothetical protein [Candidatus Lokiarchaeota archaeon]
MKSRNKKNKCVICGKVHEKRNIDLLPTWLQCNKCGRLYCVQCSGSSIRRNSIEKLLMTIIVVLFLYFGAFLFQDLEIAFTTRMTWGMLMSLLPVGFQMLLIKYHERNTLNQEGVLKECKNCSSKLNTLYYDSILNNWLFTIYAFNILVFLFEFFFKLYNLSNTHLLVFSTSFGASMFIVFLITILAVAITITVLYYKYILSGFQSSYRIWIVVIMVYIFSIIIPMILIQFSYYLLSFGLMHSDFIRAFNIIFTSTFAPIPKLFWFIPPFIISAFIYTVSKKPLMNHKVNSWLEIGLGFIIIIIPLAIWGLTYSFIHIYWDQIISWSIANFIYNLLLVLGIFSLMKKVRSKKERIDIKTILISIGLAFGLILYLLRPIIVNYMDTATTSLYITIITIFTTFLVLYELYDSWFDRKNVWRSKVAKKLPDATYLVIVGVLCYCIAMNMLYLLSLSPLHISLYIDTPLGTATSTNYLNILYPNIQIVSIIGIFGIITACFLKVLITRFAMKH